MARRPLGATVLSALVLVLLLCGSAGASVRAAFYHPWSAEQWAGGAAAVTRHTPTLGAYSSSDPAVLTQEVSWMRYANLDAGISDWNGPGTATDAAVPALLAAGGRTRSGGLSTTVPRAAATPPRRGCGRTSPTYSASTPRTPRI